MTNLGNKLEFADCGAKFYDLGLADKPCPKCGWTGTDANAEDSGPKGKAKKAEEADGEEDDEEEEEASSEDDIEELDLEPGRRDEEEVPDGQDDGEFDGDAVGDSDDSDDEDEDDDEDDEDE